MGTESGHRPWGRAGLGRLFTLLLVAVAGASGAAPQAAREPTKPASRLVEDIPPARSGLEPIPVPDLSTLEESVATQLRDAREATVDALTAADVSDADVAEAYGTLGQLYQAYELLEPAAACYRNARHLRADDVRWIQLLARLEEKAGRLDSALELYGEVRRRAPGYVAAIVHQADVLLQFERRDEARSALEAALALAPESPAVHYGLGQLALGEGDFRAAVEQFERTLELQPAADRVHYSLAMAYRGLGDREQAIRHLGLSGSVGVRVADPIFDELEGLIAGERVHLLRGRLAYAASRMEEARQEFAAALAANPSSVTARVNLAAALAAGGDTDGAIAEFRQALEIRPENPTAHFNLGALLMQQGSYEEALRHFEAVAVANPRDVETLRQLERCLRELGRADEAFEVLEHIVDLAPESEDELLRLVTELLERKRYREAYDRLDRGNALFPDRGRTAHELARLLASSPELDLRDGERALELASLVVSARRTTEHGETLAMALAEVGRCDEAAAVQEQLVQVATEHGLTDEARRLAQAVEHYAAGPPCRPGVAAQGP